MTLEEFRRLPAERQKMYLERLIELYGASQSMLGKMFGIGPAAVAKRMIKLGISSGGHVGYKPSKEQHAMWDAFRKRPVAYQTLLPGERAAGIQCGHVFGGKRTVPK